MYVFIGIETPSAEALKESKKFQNLRKDSLQQVRVIQESGLWVLAGFIVGFDSDDETIFERQREFIEKAPRSPGRWPACCRRPPTTALYDRMKEEGRLIEDSQAITNFSAPNFRTMLPLPVLLPGSEQTAGLACTSRSAFFERAFRSLEVWKTKPSQKVPDTPVTYDLRLLAYSMWTQGVRSGYRRAYWGFLWTIVRRYRNNQVKSGWGWVCWLRRTIF